jgi:hypothetical protein
MLPPRFDGNRGRDFEIMRTERTTQVSFAFGSLTIGILALALPAGVVFGAPIRGYTLLAASFGSLAGPFHQWQDYYIALSSLVNVAIYVVVPFAVIRGIWLRKLKIVAWLCAGYVATLPAMVSIDTSMAYYAWLLAVVCAAFACVTLSERQPTG